MYVRFVLYTERDERGVSVGPFAEAYRLLDDEDSLCEYDLLVLEETIDWFETELRAPRRTYKWDRGFKAGYCWFRDSAREHIHRMRVLAWLLGQYGQPLTMIRGTRPGQILYEDADQILAVPYRDSFVG